MQSAKTPGTPGESPTPAQPFSAWCRSVDSLSYPAMRTASGNQERELATFQSTKVGDISILDLRAPAGRSVRDRPSCSKTPAGVWFISLMVDGCARFGNSEREALLTPGDLLAWSADQPHTWTRESRISTICLRIPNRSAARRGPQQLTGRVVRGDSAMGGLVRGVIENLARSKMPQDAAVAYALSNGLRQSVVAALESEIYGSDRQGDKLTSAQDYIYARLHDPNLALQEVADALHVSTRSLSRVFSAKGISPIRWMWDERLKLARDLLRSENSRSVSDTALSCGFTSFSHFSREFRRAYGTSPSALKRN